MGNDQENPLVEDFGVQQVDRTDFECLEECTSTETEDNFNNSRID
jgi:hypothetical protein